MEGLTRECAGDDLADLVEAAKGIRVFAFAFNSHIADYASHEWAIDLLGWTMEVPKIQRNRVLGLLLGYSTSVIEQFKRNWTTVTPLEGEISMEPYDKDQQCPQCGGHPRDEYHTEIEQKPGQLPKPTCSDFESPHMHRKCNQCQYEWAAAPLV